MLRASGAIAAVIGACWVLDPSSRVLTLVAVFPVRIPAWVFLGGWFARWTSPAACGTWSRTPFRERTFWVTRIA